MNAFRRCIETKTLLSGDVQQYPCELLYFENTFGILRYVLDKEYHIAGTRLMPGDVTTAFYWTDRPYTLYTWQVKESGNGIFYLNIADRISLSRMNFAGAISLSISSSTQPEPFTSWMKTNSPPTSLQNYVALSRMQKRTF